MSQRLALPQHPQRQEPASSQQFALRSQAITITVQTAGSFRGSLSCFPRRSFPHHNHARRSTAPHAFFFCLASTWLEAAGRRSDVHQRSTRSLLHMLDPHGHLPHGFGRDRQLPRQVGGRQPTDVTVGPRPRPALLWQALTPMTQTRCRLSHPSAHIAVAQNKVRLHHPAALDHQLPPPLHSEVRILEQQQVCGRLGALHPPRHARRLHPRGSVYRVAQDRVLLRLAALHVSDHRPDVQANADVDVPLGGICRVDERLGCCLLRVQTEGCHARDVASHSVGAASRAEIRDGDVAVTCGQLKLLQRQTPQSNIKTKGL
eukprot:3293604-Rhodomonas_salina.1